MLGIDLGGKRTGLAFAETLSGLVMPIEVLHASEGPELDSALAELDAARAELEARPQVGVDHARTCTRPRAHTHTHTL